MPIWGEQFRDRASAGLLIANQIADENSEETVVVAIPHGGVPVAAPISRKLRVPAKVCLTTRIRLPQNPELSVGTMSCYGDIYLDYQLLSYLAASRNEITAALQSCQATIADLSSEFSQWAIDSTSEGKNFLLVDDVIATGNTVLGAVQYLQRFKPRSVSVVAPLISLYAGPLLAEQRISYSTILVSSQNQFTPQHYYASFAQVDGPTCVDILTSL